MPVAMVQDLLLEAATLLFVGMSFVFVFLTLLIIAVALLKAYCEHFPGQKTESTRVQPKAPSSLSQNQHNHIVAVITAAIQAHRQANR